MSIFIFPSHHFRLLEEAFSSPQHEKCSKIFAGKPEAKKLMWQTQGT